MTLEELILFAATQNFDAIDLTGYYFPNYPAVPSDEYIYHIKNLMHKQGLGISGTGIRTDFTDPDKINRNSQIDFVKSWIDVAAKIGAPVLRVFSGKKLPENYKWDEVANWIVDDFRECVAYAKKQGVIIGLQNHNDFIQTADQSLFFVEKLDKDWCGLIVDIGSYVTNDVYDEIVKVIHHAVNWQIKELVYIKNKIEPVDLKKIKSIISQSSYRGYLPIETLAQGDLKYIVINFHNRVKEVFF
jgi:sugar phosphate isomerase/epimerase